MSAARRSGPAKPADASGRVRRPKCPICGKAVSPDYRPFCSKHCADIDLGRWLDGRYALPAEAVSGEDGEEEETEE